MSLKIKKGIPLIDQHDKNFMYGGKFGGNFIPETLKKPIDDLTKLFSKLRKDRKFIKERDYWINDLINLSPRSSDCVYTDPPPSFLPFLVVTSINLSNPNGSEINGSKNLDTGPSSPNIKFITNCSVSCGFRFCFCACAIAASNV